MRIFIIILAAFCINCLGCTSNKVTGLWIVDNVQVGDQKMTPNARWVRLNKDGTQQSGNGWYQHMQGTWSFDKASDAIAIANVNSPEDPFGPFTVEFAKEAMTWSRDEGGMEVLVTLSTIDEIPSSAGDILLGIWDLTSATEDGKTAMKDLDPLDNRYLFIRWDKIVEIRNTPDGTIRGIYRVDPHRPVIEIAYYGQDRTYEQWSFTIDGNTLNLSSTKDGVTRTREYKRIYTFPE